MKQFTVICTRDQYDEVAEILEGWGYGELPVDKWIDGEDCVSALSYGSYMTYKLEWVNPNEPRYTLEELRIMKNPNTKPQ